MAGTDDAAGRGATVWVDEREVDPSWAPPTVDPSWPAPSGDVAPIAGAERRRSRRLLSIGLPVLLLVMIIIAVWAAGGFEVRTDGPVPIEPGKEFATGPYVYTFERATVQNVESYGDHPRVEEVIVYGTARNTWTETLRPYSREFLGSDKAGQVIESDLFRLDSESFDGPDELAPGIPAQPVKVSFEFPPTAEFGDTVRLGVRDLVYENDSVFTTSDQKTWSPDGRRIYRIDVPLKRLPREEEL